MHEQEHLSVVVPDQCTTGTHPVLITRGAQRSDAAAGGQLPPPPATLFEITVGERFGLDTQRCGGGLDFAAPDPGAIPDNRYCAHRKCR